MISEGNDPILFLPELGGSDIELSFVIKTEITSPGACNFFGSCLRMKGKAYRRGQRCTGIEDGAKCCVCDNSTQPIKVAFKATPGGYSKCSVAERAIRDANFVKCI